MKILQKKMLQASLPFCIGYLSSRPGLKGYAIKFNAHLQACYKQLEHS